MNTWFRTSQERVSLSVCYEGQFTSKVLGVSSGNVIKLKIIRKRQVREWKQYLIVPAEGVKKQHRRGARENKKCHQNMVLLHSLCYQTPTLAGQVSSLLFSFLPCTIGISSHTLKKFLQRLNEMLS